ncbi:CRISPR-associated endonuclease Cas1, partial [Bacteroides fragilis]|uniref:CRISPR-associated endonuclease Cas1 n=1 Tax=Bacteroides fragilis TaxID=817 RepID=UPI0005CE3BFD
AIESQAAIAYWSYIRVLTADDGIDFIRREHQGATDLLNSLLNYGYVRSIRMDQIRIIILMNIIWINFWATKDCKPVMN